MIYLDANILELGLGLELLVLCRFINCTVCFDFMVTLTHYGLVATLGVMCLSRIGPGNDLLLDGPKQLPESMLTCNK